MATKTKTPEAGPVGAEQPEQTINSTPELATIDTLRKKHKTGRAVFAGVCAANGWRPGKAITEEEYLAAVAGFTGGPASPRPRKEAKG